MNKEKKHHTADEQHTAMDKIGGFVYQFYYFLYLLLRIEEGEEVSFEKLDDAAVESGESISLVQVKHTVKVSVAGEMADLTNRSTDLWKAVDVWRKLIVGNEDENRTTEDKKKYIEAHQFVFVSNKDYVDNKFAQLCHDLQTSTSPISIDQVLDEITGEGKSRQTTAKGRTIQMMIDDLKSFELKEAFLSRISFESISQTDLRNKCVEAIKKDAWFAEDEAEVVFDDFLCEAVKDFSKQADLGKPLTYTYQERRERFLKVIQNHREDKLDFRILKQQYKKEFLDLVCIQQLIKVKDFAASQTDKVAKCASRFYSFKNTFDDLRENSKILDIEEEMFMEEALGYWENEFENAYDGLDDTATEDEIVEKAKSILYEVRKQRLKLCNELLNQPISDGAFYYLSDECIIGWHKNWREFFKTQGEQDG